MPTERRRAAALLLLALASACAPRPLVARAIRARGGPLRSVVRRVEAEVYAGFPGTWRWRAAFLVPDRYAWTILTTREPDHYLFDGTVVRAFVGDVEVAADADAAAPLRTHARFTAVTDLDALLQPGVQVAAAAADRVPPGAVAALEVRFPDDGSRYLLGFDRRDLLVTAAGPLALPPLGRGTISARFADFRRAGSWLLPWTTDYTFDGAPLATEHTLAACPDDPALTPESFRRPAAIPDCAAPRD